MTGHSGSFVILPGSFPLVWTFYKAASGKIIFGGAAVNCLEGGMTEKLIDGDGFGCGLAAAGLNLNRSDAGAQPDMMGQVCVVHKLNGRHITLLTDLQEAESIGLELVGDLAEIIFGLLDNGRIPHAPPQIIKRYLVLLDGVDEIGEDVGVETAVTLLPSVHRASPNVPAKRLPGLKFQICDWERNDSGAQRPCIHG